MFEGGGDEWPWRYRAEQQFQLSPNALSVSLSVENLALSSMPAMLGLHPYSARPHVRACRRTRRAYGSRIAPVCPSRRWRRPPPGRSITPGR